MRKFYSLLVIALLSLTVTLQAQVATNYVFSSSAGSYTPISGGTKLVDGTSSMDSWVSSAITIPSFTFNGTAYTTAYVTSNGILTLGGTAPSEYTTTGISITTGSGYVICPFSADLDRANSNANTEIRWETVGDEVVFQWKQMKRYGRTENFDFQVRLNTVSGEILFVYNLNSGPDVSTLYQPQVGIRTSATDYNNRLVASGSETWSSSLKGTANTSLCRFTSASPQKNFTSGLTYSWSLVSCLSPSAPTGSPTSTTAANISWTAPNTPPANGYEWVVDQSPSDPAGSGTAESGTSTSVSGLTANTTYYLHVRSDCGGGDYSAWATVSFKTPCDAVTTYTQNWDGVTAPALPDCFYKVGSLGSVYTQASSASSSPNTLYIYATSQSSQPTLALQPVSNAGANTHWLKFKLRANFTVGDTLQVGYLTNPSDASSFVLLQEYRAAALTYTEYTCDPGVAPGSNQILALRAKGSISASMLVDDLRWEAKPSCLAPTAPTGSPTSTTTANISWTAPNTPPANGYEWVVDQSPSDPAGSGTAEAGTSTSVSGLTANTTYYLHVRSDCGGGDYSAWATVSFKTPCDAISSFPWTEGFNNATRPDCWSEVFVSGTTAWTYVTTNGNNTISPHTGTRMAEFRVGSRGTATKLITPPLDLTSLTSPRLRFYFANVNWTGDIDELRVYYKANPADPWTQIGSDYITEHTSWEEVILDLPNPSSTYYIAFEATSNWARGLNLDDVTVEEAPSCLSPTAPTGSPTSTTTANISWTAPNTPPANGYEYWVSTSATPPVSGTAEAGTSTSVSGLTANTTYYLHVRSVCGVGDTSVWATSTAFTTPCNAISSFPWTENFDGVTVPALPSCFASLDVNNDNDKWITYTSYGVNGTQAAGLYTDYNAGNNDDYLVLPPFSLTGNQRFRFSVRARSASEPNDFRVVLSTTGNTPADFASGTELKPLTTVSNITHANIDWIDLSSYTGIVYIAVHVPSGGLDGWYLYVDDMIVEDIPSCLPPTAPTGSPTSPTAANISWTAPNTPPANGYEYWVSTSATPPVSGTAEAGTSTSVSGLTAYTTYYLHVRSVCSVGDTSAWVTSASFTTPAAIPWSETFSTATLPTGWAVSSYSGPSTVTALNSGTTSNYMYKNLYSSQPTGYFTTVNVGVVSGSEALSFRYRTANFAGPYDPPVSGSGNFVVEISTDNGATYSTLETVVNDGIAGWKNKTYDLSPYAGEVVKIKITGNWISGDYYLGFDDFQIADACTAPVAQPTSLTLSPGTTTVDGSFTAAVADGYLVVRTDGTPPTDPVDGTTYTAGQSALGGVIVASGSSTSFTATGLTPATNYSFYVYSYNNTGCVGIAYLTASPLNDNTTTTSVFVSVQSGAWEDPNTWDMNAVPSGNDVTIATTHTVTINGAAASAGIININGGGTLQVTGNTLSAIAINNTGVFTTTGGTTNLSGTIGSGITNNSAAVFGVAGGTVNLGPAGGGDRTFTNNGTLNVSSGSLTINGNYSQITATGSIIQTGGDIIVDGNAAGVLANSVPSGTYIFQVGNSSNPATPAKLNLSGGTITIVDPHASATATYSVYIYVSSHFSATGTHTFKFGDGVSTDAGGNSNGFYTYTYPGSFYALNNVTVDAGNGINRAYTHYLFANRIGGNITINSGEFFNNNGLYVNGDIVNNGIFTSQSTLYLSKYTDGSNVAGTNAQTISGTGVFRDNQTSPTANFGPVTVNNTNVSGITFAGGISSPSFRTSITVTNGKLNADVINLNGATSISLPAGTSIINTGDLIHNTLGTITVSGSGFLNVSGNFKFGNVDSREFKTGGLLVLKSTATGTGRIADITNGGVNSGNTITGSVMQERFVPAKASRKWIFLSSPLSSTVQNSWQQQIHVTGSGTGGTVCPTLSAHTNGFDATVSNAPSMYVYDASQAQGSRWASIANTNSTNVGQGVGFRVNVRGERTIGCSLLDGSQSGLAPTAVTLRSLGLLSPAQKNFGTFSITYPNNGTGNYVFIGNPYPSAISFSALQAANLMTIGSTYAIYIPSNLASIYTYWDDNAGEFTGGAGGDDATGDIIANGQAVFLESSVAGNLTLNFNEELKTTETNTGYFRPARVFNEKVKVSYLQNNNKVDEVVIRYANDAGVSNTEKGKLDITSMNSGTYISSLKGGKEMVVQTRDLRTLSNDEVWLNIGATASGTYQLSFSEFENFGGTEIILKDHYTGTEQNIKQNDKYEFSVDKDNAATKGSTRFSVVFNRTVNPEYVSNIIKLYPNPASKQVTLELPQVADNSIVYNVRVTDIAGKVVMQQKVNAGTHQLTIDRLTTGTYFVEIIDSKGNRTTEKLVKN